MNAVSFEAVAKLPASEQRRLLQNGDGPERLWSAWALALQLGSAAIPVLTEVQQGDVSEGVKRQLLIVLAGLGERSLLMAVAEADPSPSVRATATALYLRTAASATDPDCMRFILKQLSAGPAEVCCAVLAEHDAGRLMIPLSEQLTLLRNPSASVRQASLASLAANPARNEDAPTSRALIELFADEQGTDLLQQCVALLPRAAIRDLLQTVAARLPKRLAEAVRIAHAQFGPLSWSDVQRVAQTSALTDLLAILMAEVRPEPPAGLAWLCRALRLASDDDSRLGGDLRWRSLAMIQDLLSVDTVVMLASADRAMLQATFSEVLLELQRHIDDYGPDSEEGYAHEVERVVELLSQP